MSSPDRNLVVIGEALPGSGSLRWALLTALVSGALSLGVLAADEEQVKWVKLDEARAKSAATGKPVLVICITDLIPDGPAAKGIDRSFTSELVRPLKDDFLFVKCSDMNTVKAVKATSKCELITFDPDGDEILRIVVKSTPEIAAAMKKTLTIYANRPIQWSAEAPSPIERSPGGKLLTIVLFRSASEETDALVRSLEDRVVAKLHPACTFVAMEFRKGSADIAQWNILASPTLLLLDAEKEFGPKSVIDRSSDRKSPKEVKAFLRKGLAAVAKSHR